MITLHEFTNTVYNARKNHGSVLHMAECSDPVLR